MAIAPALPDTWYAAGRDRPNWEDGRAVVVRSLDDGTSWTEVLATNPANDGIV